MPVRGTAIGDATHRQTVMPTELDGSFVLNIKPLFNVVVTFPETTTQSETTRRSVAIIPSPIIN